MSSKKTFTICALLMAALLAFCRAGGPGVSGRGGEAGPRFFEILSDDLKKTGVPHQVRVAGLAYNGRDQSLIVGSGAGEVEIWDMAAGTKRAAVRLGSSWPANFLVSDDGQSFFAEIPGHGVELRDARTARLLRSLPNLRWPLVYAGAGHLYLVNDLAGVRLYDDREKAPYLDRIDDGRPVSALAAGHETGLAAIARGRVEVYLELYQLRRDGPTPKLEKLKNIEAYANRNIIVGLHFAPGGKSFYTRSIYGLMEQWSAPSLEKLRSLPLPDMAVTGAKMLPGGEVMAVFGRLGPQGVRDALAVQFLSPSSGRAVGLPVTICSDFMSCAGGATVFIPDLNKLVMVHDGRVTAIDIP